MKTSVFLKNAHQALSCKVHIAVYSADQVNIQTHKTITNHTCSQWTLKDTGQKSLAVGQHQASPSTGFDLTAVSAEVHRAVLLVLFPPGHNSEVRSGAQLADTETT